MKHSDSTEMDRLLRRYARRSGETLPARHGASDETAAGESSSVAHLDADEMNAYAEGALPEAARTRYFAHLADCATCRKLVTELTLAASLADEGKARIASLDAAPSKSWREWLAALFSPPVLRYGVPALALFAVITIAIVAMMTQRKESSVAQNQGRASAPSTATTSNSAAETQTATGTAENHPNSNVAPLIEQQSQAQPDVAATPSAKPAPMEGEDASIVSQEGVANSATAAQTTVTERKAGEFGVAGKREQEEVAAAPPPPAPQSPVPSAPAATTAPGNRDKREEPKKAKTADKDDSNKIAVDGTSAGGVMADRAETSEARKDVGRTATARAPENQQRRRPLAATKSGPPSDAAREKESSVETRSVGGRRFRRQGSAWVDTAYNSSRSTTNVARGSEQYRALVADEPGLRPIAEQLGGQVIVVWKSRAYRFY